ncbi:type IV pilus twitching motility protein PilT [Hippea maritima]|uniref:Twitching motility protein n=1 Tax=Hippea maritima (strain ATCC 700847 / DSM 10411 / MH2) TaxID=760142 RepID=F2LUC1_HIPMA|nr:type IV pilus twitching motility protein PilT [Hippea maritima]AEA33447.1 twitching motility protein [Hippea maritima DSM 10411]
MGKKAQDLVELLEKMISIQASDLHITAGARPKVRVDSELMDMEEYDELSPADAQNLCYSVMTELQKKTLEEDFDVDFSFGIPKLSRFRANVYIQRGTIAGAFRMIPFEIPQFDKLGIPPVVQQFAHLKKGIVLVTGPTGSGKSTTLAALLDKINAERKVHIITIEDPIEFTYSHKLALIDQREVGSDVKSFASALKHILRQDPDVILIGEMRDLETIQAALTVAETGHLVFATLHTNSAPETINRIIDVFPPNQQEQVRTQLSVALQGVASQTLIKRKDGKGRVLAMEIMIPNSAIRNLIRENKIPQIYSSMQMGQTETGMMTMNQSIISLYKKGFISYEAAIEASNDKKAIQRELDKIRYAKG